MRAKTGFSCLHLLDPIHPVLVSIYRKGNNKHYFLESLTCVEVHDLYQNILYSMALLFHLLVFANKKDRLFNHGTHSFV